MAVRLQFSFQRSEPKDSAPHSVGSCRSPRFPEILLIGNRKKNTHRTIKPPEHVHIDIIIYHIIFLVIIGMYLNPIGGQKSHLKQHPKQCIKEFTAPEQIHQWRVHRYAPPLHLHLGQGEVALFMMGSTRGPPKPQGARSKNELPLVRSLFGTCTEKRDNVLMLKRHN